MKKLFKILFLLIVILPANAYAGRETALKKPIVEGTSTAGISIGDDESEIFRAIGFPDIMESSFLREPHATEQGLKSLLYGLDTGNLIFMYTRYGKVEAVQLFWMGLGQDSAPSYTGKTGRGIGLGDRIKDVQRYYAGCKNKGQDNGGLGWFCWDKDSGIYLGADTDNLIRLIGIAAPGKELPDYLKPEKQNF